MRRSASRGTTISACSARSTSRSSPATRSWPRAGRAACWPRARARSSSRCGRRAHADGVELFHASPRDPVWEYVLSADVAARRARADRVAARARRPQPRPAGDHARGRRPRRRPRAERDDDAARRPAAGCSTRARSASRATAIRARPGCCSTSRPARPRSGGSSTTSRARRRRSARGGCPMRWRNGLLTASSALAARRRCGGGHRATPPPPRPPRIPAGVAARLAAEADRVAGAHAGHAARRATRPSRFRNDVIASIGRIPAALPGAAHLARPTASLPGLRPASSRSREPRKHKPHHGHHGKHGEQD